MNKLTKISAIIAELEELKNESMTESEREFLGSILYETKRLRNMWVFSDLEKQAFEFLRDLKGTMSVKGIPACSALTIPEIADIMEISIPRATKFIRVCANRGWILTWIEGNYII